MERVYNETLEHYNFTDLQYLHSRMSVAYWVISCFAFPIICAAIYGLYCQIKSDHVAPVFVINLLVSDMLQICTKPVWHMTSLTSIVHFVLFFLYSLGLCASISFMLCISAERYVMIAYPIWYRCKCTKKKLLCASLMVWATAVIIMLIISLVILIGNIDRKILTSSFLVFYVLPYPLVICFLTRTCRALSSSKSVPAHEKRRIMGTLTLILFIYTVFFLPYIVLLLTFTISPALLNKAHMQNFASFVDLLLSMNPIADPILYVFIRRDVLGAMACCVKKQKDQPSTLQTLE